MPGRGDRTAARQRSGSPQKPTNVEIDIDRHFSTKTYTSGEVIAGHAIVHTQRNVSFDHIEILFLGVAATRLHFVQQFPANSVRSFMKLRMPIPDSALPEDRVFKAGEVYRIPFDFVVPHQLTIGACNHINSCASVRDKHLRLPPSIGCWVGEDMAPEMAHIEYSIRCKVTREEPDNTQTKLVDGRKMVKVFPASPEDAPLDITAKDERYTLSKSKTVRKGLLPPKTGKLTASAKQPGAVMMVPDDARDVTGTAARIDLEYVPTSPDTTPPKINTVSAKVVANTFFSSAPINNIPDLGSRSTLGANPLLSYTNTTNLFTVPVENISWTQHRMSMPRRDSGYSSDVVDEDATESDGSIGHHRQGSKGKKSRGSPFRHTTSLNVPIRLPQDSLKKIFLPTFHSCLISRTYTLQLVVSVGPGNTTMTLSLPLQVGVLTVREPQADGDQLPSFETAVAQAEEDEANAYLQPRSLQAPYAVPRQSNSRRQSILPGYDEVNRQTVSVA